MSAVGDLIGGGGELGSSTGGQASRDFLEAIASGYGNSLDRDIDEMDRREEAQELRDLFEAANAERAEAGLEPFDYQDFFLPAEAGELPTIDPELLVDSVTGENVLGDDVFTEDDVAEENAAMYDAWLAGSPSGYVPPAGSPSVEEATEAAVAILKQAGVTPDPEAVENVLMGDGGWMAGIEVDFEDWSATDVLKAILPGPLEGVPLEILGVLKEAGADIGDILSGEQKVGDVLGDWGQAAQDAVGDLVDGFKGSIEGILTNASTVGSAVGSIGDWIKNNVPAPLQGDVGGYIESNYELPPIPTSPPEETPPVAPPVETPPETSSPYDPTWETPPTEQPPYPTPIEEPVAPEVPAAVQPETTSPTDPTQSPQSTWDQQAAAQGWTPEMIEYEREKYNEMYGEGGQPYQGIHVGDNPSVSEDNAWRGARMGDTIREMTEQGLDVGDTENFRNRVDSFNLNGVDIGGFSFNNPEVNDQTEPPFTGNPEGPDLNGPEFSPVDGEDFLSPPSMDEPTSPPDVVIDDTGGGSGGGSGGGDVMNDFMAGLNTNYEMLNRRDVVQQSLIKSLFGDLL